MHSTSCTFIFRFRARARDRRSTTSSSPSRRSSRLTNLVMLFFFFFYFILIVHSESKHTRSDLLFLIDRYYIESYRDLLTNLFFFIFQPRRIVFHTHTHTHTLCGDSTVGGHRSSCTQKITYCLKCNTSKYIVHRPFEIWK